MAEIYFHKYNNAFSCDDVYLMVKDYGETNTDTSTWKPDLSLARVQLGSSVAPKNLLYDFPDGVDTGETVQTFIRSKGLDITEIETAEKRITQIIEDKKISDKEKADAEQQKKDLLNALKGSKNDSSSDTDDTSSTTITQAK